MLDTDVASYLIRGEREQMLRKLRDLRPQQLCVSAMTRAELLYGLRKLSASSRLHVLVKRFLETLQVLAWPVEAAEFYANIRHQLTETGKPIGELDMLIAAHALAIDATLVTNNVRHFERVELPLMLKSWSE